MGDPFHPASSAMTSPWGGLGSIGRPTSAITPFESSPAMGTPANLGNHFLDANPSPSTTGVQSTGASTWTSASKFAMQTRERGAATEQAVTFDTIYPTMAPGYNGFHSTQNPYHLRVTIRAEVSKADRKSIDKVYNNDNANTLTNDICGELESKGIPDQRWAAIQADTLRLDTITRRKQMPDSTTMYNNTTTIGVWLRILEDAPEAYLRGCREVYEYYLARATSSRHSNDEEKEDEASFTPRKTRNRTKQKPADKGQQDTAAGAAAPEEADSPSWITHELWPLTKASKRITADKVRDMIDRKGKATAEQRDAWFYQQVAESLIESAGGTAAECGIEGEGQIVWLQAVSVLKGVCIELAQAEAILIDERDKASPQAEKIAGRAQEILKNDIMVMLGGPAVIQAAYCNATKYLRLILMENKTKQIVEYLNDLTMYTAESGSIVGRALGIIETGADCTGVLMLRITGTGTTLERIRAGTRFISQHNVTDDTCTKHAKKILNEFGAIRHAASLVPGGDNYLGQIIASGDFDICAIIIEQCLDTPIDRGPCPAGSRMRHVLENALHDLRNLRANERTLPRMIHRTTRFAETLQQIDESTKTAKRRKTRPKTTMAAVLTGDGSASDDEETDYETSSQSSTATGDSGSSQYTRSEMDTYIQALTALALTQNAPKGMTSSNSLTQRFKHLEDDDFIQPVDNNIKTKCNYCGKTGHKIKNCSPYGYDVKHKQKFAHASDEYLEYQRGRGVVAIRPPEGKTRKWHGRTKDVTNLKKDDAGALAAQSTAPSATNAGVLNSVDIGDVLIKLQESMQKMNKRMEGVETNANTANEVINGLKTMMNEEDKDDE